MEKNTKLGKVLLILTVQKNAHVWDMMDLDALVYVYQNQSSVNKEREKNDIKIMSTTANAFVTENVVLKVTALYFCNFFSFLN